MGLLVGSQGLQLFGRPLEFCVGHHQFAALSGQLPAELCHLLQRGLPGFFFCQALGFESCQGLSFGGLIRFDRGETLGQDGHVHIFGPAVRIDRGPLSQELLPFCLAVE